MDASTWKLVVDRAISRTEAGTLKWTTSDDGPVKTIGFIAAIDETTALSFWGYETNFSYELSLTKQTGGEPFVAKKRITTKKKSEGIRCKALLDAVQRQMVHIPRRDAFNAVMEYLSDPLANRSHEERGDLMDCWGKMESLGWNDFFLYSQTREILRTLTTLTTCGTITWHEEMNNTGVEEWGTDIGELLHANLSVETPAVGAGRKTYRYSLYDSGDGALSVSEEQDPDIEDVMPPLWSTMEKLHRTILSMNPTDNAKFEDIIRENIVQEILAALDSPGR